MKTQIPKNRVHLVLTAFVVLSIIGEVGNVVFWWVNPSSQISLVGGTIGDVTSPGGILFDAVGGANALVIGSVLLLVVAAVYAVSLFGLVKNQKWAPLLVIAISVINRVFALVIFYISPALAFWAAWTVILVVLGFLEYKRLASPKPQPALA